jgi:hypothetical protein
MSEYAERFAESDIDTSVLRDLTDQDLKELGVSLGHRRKMLRAIAELSGAAPTLPQPESTEPKTKDAAERRLALVGPGPARGSAGPDSLPRLRGCPSASTHQRRRGETDWRREPSNSLLTSWCPLHLCEKAAHSLAAAYRPRSTRACEYSRASTRRLMPVIAGCAPFTTAGFARMLERAGALAKPPWATTRGRCRPISGIVISSTRFATRSCLRCGSKIFGGSERLPGSLTFL